MGIGRNRKNARTNTDLVTLTRLLELRNNQEHTLRRCISQSREKQEKLKWEAQGCLVKRQDICEKLKILAQWQGVLDTVELTEQKELFHSLYQQERQQLSKRNEMLRQLKQLSKDIQALEFSLKRNLIKQEKLRILIEDESNRY